MRAEGLLAAVALALLVLMPSVLGQAGEAPINPEADYISCPARNGDVLTGLLRDAVTGRTVGILVYRLGESSVEVLRNDLPASMRVLHAYPLRNGEILVAALDRPNGTIMVLVSSPGRGTGVLGSASKIYTIGVRGGFIRSAYARLDNTSLLAAVSALIFHGNKSEEHVLIVRADLSSGEASAMGLPLDSLGMNLTGFEPCSPALVGAANESLDIATLFTPLTSAKTYHVLLPSDLKPDTYSMIVRPGAESSLIIAHPAREPNRILIISLSAAQAKAIVYTSPALPGITSFEPKAVARVNHSVYAIYATAITSRGAQEGLIAIAVLGASPRIEVYPIAGMIPAPLTPSTALLVGPAGEARRASLENLTLYSSTPIFESMSESTFGLTIAPLRLSSKYNVTIEKAAIQGSSSGTSSTTTEARKPQGTQKRPPPPPATTGEGENQGHRRLKMVALLLVLVAAVAASAVLASRLVGKKRSRGVMGEPVIRY